SFADLASGASESAVLEFLVTGVPGTTVANTLSILAVENDPLPSDNVATVETSIFQPTVSVASPGIGAVWAVGSLRSIEWSHKLRLEAVCDVDLSGDDGATWETLAGGVRAATATTGSFAWMVSGAASITAHVRVTTEGASAESGRFT